MARSVTLQSISDRARIHADMRETSFIDATDMLALINEVYPELYDELVATYENYYTSTATITLAPGTSSYALPTDMYKILGVDFQVSAGSYITIYPYTEGERNTSIISTAGVPSGTVRIRYVPAPPTFTSLSQSVDGVSGWDRLLSLLLAIDMLDAEESDTKALTRKYMRTLDRVQSMAPVRDAGSPARVVDITSPKFDSIYANLKYRMYGGNIEFINTEYVGVTY